MWNYAQYPLFTIAALVILVALAMILLLLDPRNIQKDPYEEFDYDKYDNDNDEPPTTA